MSRQVEKRQTWTHPQCKICIPPKDYTVGAEDGGGRERDACLVATWKKVQPVFLSAKHPRLLSSQQSDGIQINLCACCSQTERQCRHIERNPEGTKLFELGWVAMKHKYSSAVFKQKERSVLREGQKSDCMCYFCSRRLFVLDGNETANLTLCCFCTSRNKTMQTLTSRPLFWTLFFISDWMETCCMALLEDTLMKRGDSLCLDLQVTFENAPKQQH